MKAQMQGGTLGIEGTFHRYNTYQIEVSLRWSI
jgi:hypothetical protein